MNLEPNERLFARTLSPDVDPNGSRYVSTVRDDDPFLYRPSKRVRVSNSFSGTLLHYDLYGIPVGFRPDWQERMTEKKQIVIGLGNSQSAQFTATLQEIKRDPKGTRLNNVLDRDDPYVYRLVDIVEQRLLHLVFYQLLGEAVDLKQEWRTAVLKAQKEGASASYSWGDNSEEEFFKADQEARQKQRQRSSAPTRSRQRQPLETHYRVLGLKRTASKEEVKQAYRRLAHQYHPDVNPAPDAATRFVAINQAYQTLIVVVPG